MNLDGCFRQWREDDGASGDGASDGAQPPATSGVTGRRSNQLSYTPQQGGRALEPQNPRSQDGKNLLFEKRSKNFEAHKRRDRQRWDHHAGVIARPTWAVTGSNRRPSRWKRDALPLS